MVSLAPILANEPPLKMNIVIFEPRGVPNVLIKGSNLSVAEFCDRVANSAEEQEPGRGTAPGGLLWAIESL